LFLGDILAIRKKRFDKYEKEHMCWQQFVLKKFVRKQAHFWYEKSHQQLVFKAHPFEETLRKRAHFSTAKSSSTISIKEHIMEQSTFLFRQ